MYRISNIILPGNCTIEVQADTLKNAWQEVSFLQQLPHTCPVDGSATRFSFGQRGGFDWYELVSTGAVEYRFRFGTEQDSKELFPGYYLKAEKRTVRRWTHWDAEQKCEIIAWEDGRLIVNGKQSEPDDRLPESECVSLPPLAPGPQLNEKEKLKIEIEQLGNKLLGSVWPQNRRADAVAWASNNSAERLVELNVEQLTKIVVWLRKESAKKQATGK